MFKLIRQILASAAILGAVVLPQAHAGLASTVIDFEGDIAGLYFPVDVVSHADFVMAPTVDFGTIDTIVLGLDPAVAPTGNDTQVYFSSNDGGLALARQDGGKFNLDGFSAAFVPQETPLVPQNIVIVAYAWFADLSDAGWAWSLGNTSSTPPSNHPFTVYNNANNASTFAFFTDVVLVEFFACVADEDGICVTRSNNNAQFAIDDIHVSTVTDDGSSNGNGTVPEPGTLALLSLGLLGLCLRSRRNSL